MAVSPRIRFLQKANKLQKDSSLLLPPVSLHSSMRNSADERSSSEDEQRATAVDDSREAYTFNMADHSDDELFSLARRILPKDEDLVEDTNLSKNKSTKPVTKAALAKKLLKKKIKPNTRKIFAEDGEELSESVPRQQLSAAAKALLVDSTEGGINIETAKAVMREEDQIDKQLYSQRVKIMHKKQRLKEKEELRKQKSSSRKKVQEEDEKEDDIEENFVDEDESDSESISALIDALPDPDKVYSKSRQHEDENNDDKNSEQASEKEGNTQSSDSDSDNRHKLVLSRKRKFKAKEGHVKKKRKSVPSEDVLDTGLTLADDEELALHLLTAS